LKFGKILAEIQKSRRIQAKKILVIPVRPFTSGDDFHRKLAIFGQNSMGILFLVRVVACGIVAEEPEGLAAHGPTPELFMFLVEMNAAVEG